MSANNSNDGRDETAHKDMPARANIVLIHGTVNAARLRDILARNRLETGTDIDKMSVVYQYVDVDEAGKSRVIVAHHHTPTRKLWAEQHRRIVLPPGHKLSVVAGFLLTRGAFKRYVEPVIADMQKEYIDAIAARQEARAHWIAIRVYMCIIPGWFYALVAGKLAALLRRGR
jgi:hypothetical protein